MKPVNTFEVFVSFDKSNFANQEILAANGDLQIKAVWATTTLKRLSQ
jgi:hypothetical protein